MGSVLASSWSWGRVSYLPHASGEGMFVTIDNHPSSLPFFCYEKLRVYIQKLERVHNSSNWVNPAIWYGVIAKPNRAIIPYYGCGQQTKTISTFRCVAYLESGLGVWKFPVLLIYPDLWIFVWYNIHTSNSHKFFWKILLSVCL